MGPGGGENSITRMVPPINRVPIREFASIHGAYRCPDDLVGGTNSDPILMNATKGTGVEWPS